MGAKLNEWAVDDPYRRFVDVSNRTADPASLLTAWRRRSNRGADDSILEGAVTQTDRGVMAPPYPGSTEALP